MTPVTLCRNEQLIHTVSGKESIQYSSHNFNKCRQFRNLWHERRTILILQCTFKNVPAQHCRPTYGIGRTHVRTSSDFIVCPIPCTWIGQTKITTLRTRLQPFKSNNMSYEVNEFLISHGIPKTAIIPKAPATRCSFTMSIQQRKSPNTDLLWTLSGQYRSHNNCWLLLVQKTAGEQRPSHGSGFLPVAWHPTRRYVPPHPWTESVLVEVRRKLVPS